MARVHITRALRSDTGGQTLRNDYYTHYAHYKLTVPVHHERRQRRHYCTVHHHHRHERRQLTNTVVTIAVTSMLCPDSRYHHHRFFCIRALMQPVRGSNQSFSICITLSFSLSIFSYFRILVLSPPLFVPRFLALPFHLYSPLFDREHSYFASIRPTWQRRPGPGAARTIRVRFAAIYGLRDRLTTMFHGVWSRWPIRPTTDRFNYV